MSTPPALARIPTLLMLAGFAASSLLHLGALPAWCSMAALAAVLWRWLHLQQQLALPGNGVRVGLALLLLASVLATFRTVGGLTAGSALLVVMGAAKLLETRGARDAVVVATVALVLVLAAILDRQSLARLPWYLATAWLALAGIAALGNHSGATSAPHAFAQAGKAALLAVPLALLCFVLVPRLPGALWSTPPNPQAMTGLGDEMSPGSISELAESSEVVFRVRFDGAAPPPSERYWRGPVLHDFDGSTWRRVRSHAAVTQPAQPMGEPLRYQVLLEPHGRNDLFALETATGLAGAPRHLPTFDGQLLAMRAVTAPVIYKGTSHLRMRYTAPLSNLGRELDTHLPAGSNPRSVALAHQLRREVDSDAAYVSHVLDWFRSNGFGYTLSPPLLATDPVDGLLFGTRLGFCGHYASAYVLLMRAAGIPARVVTGYLGGSWNAVAGYYVVRQSAAHAWAEVWLEGRGWTRVDPTAVVAPERLERELADLLPESRSAAEALLSSTRWLRDLRDRWDAANGWWLERVVNFNRAQQQGLLAKLGLDRIDYGGMALLLAAGAALWAALLFAWLALRAPRPRHDALGRIWMRYLALLARRGLAVADHDGPEALRQRAQRQWPSAAAEIDAFTRSYEQLRFGRGDAADPATLRQLERRLRAISRAVAASARSPAPPRTA